MAENVDNAKDTEEASCVTDKAVDKEKESEPISGNKEEIDEEGTNENTESECQKDTGEVESSEKKTDDNHENGGEEVVTLDDEGGDEERVPTKTIPDPVFFESVSEEEKQYYEENPISADKIELMKVQCTACFKQVLSNICNKNIKKYLIRSIIMWRTTSNGILNWEFPSVGNQCQLTSSFKAQLTYLSLVLEWIPFAS